MKPFDLETRRKELKLTYEQIGDFVGVSKSTVQKWASGFIDNMKRDKIALLAKILKVSPLEILEIDDDETIGAPYNPIVHEIPILGYIAAGMPIYAEEHIEGYTYTDKNGGAEYFALRVKGDSMSALNINEGNLIIVRRQPKVENGEIAVVRVEGESATVKRYKQNDNIIQLIPQSFNPEHDVQIYDATKTKIEVIGKVVECKIEF